MSVNVKLHFKRAWSWWKITKALGTSTFQLDSLCETG